MKKIQLYLLVGTLSMILIVFPGSLVSGDATSEVDLTITPDQSLFAVENMKPGDWAPRTVTIENSGTKDFAYSISLRNDGDAKLFNELLLEIHDEANELYKGKLADFTMLDGRELAVNQSEELKWTIRFPTGLGNEFQGLDVRFSLLFSAEADEGTRDAVIIDSEIGTDGRDDGSGSVLPKTATNQFTWIVIGTVLLGSGIFVFIYRKRTGRERRTS